MNWVQKILRVVFHKSPKRCTCPDRGSRGLTYKDPWCQIHGWK